MKKDLAIAAIAILAVTTIAFALDKTRPDLPLTPSQPFSEKAAAPRTAKTGKVIMHVNGEPVTEAEFNAFAAAGVPAEQRAFVTGSPQGRRLLANEIVKLKMLEQEARRLGLSSDPEVKTQLEMTETQIIAMRALDKIVRPKVEQYVRAEFEREKNNTIELRHVVVAYAGGQLPSRDGSQRPLAQALQKAQSVAARLRGGADFAALARAESDDQQSAMNGGLLGPMRREMIPTEIVPVITKLKPGQISDPVRTGYAVHVFRVDPPSLEQMRPALMQNAQRQAMEETLAELQKDAKVELDPSFFPQQQSAPPPPATKSNG